MQTESFCVFAFVPLLAAENRACLRKKGSTEGESVCERKGHLIQNGGDALDQIGRDQRLVRILLQALNRDLRNRFNEVVSTEETYWIKPGGLLF